MRRSSAARLSSERVTSAPSRTRSASPDRSAASGVGALSTSRGSSSEDGSGSGSRLRLRSCSRKTRRAIPSSQADRRSPSSSERSFAWARTKVSWVASPAAGASRKRSPRKRLTAGAWRSKITRKASDSPARARSTTSRSKGGSGARARSANAADTGGGDIAGQLVSGLPTERHRGRFRRGFGRFRTGGIVRLGGTMSETRNCAGSKSDSTVRQLLASTLYFLLEYVGPDGSVPQHPAPLPIRRPLAGARPRRLRREPRPLLLPSQAARARSRLSPADGMDVPGERAGAPAPRRRALERAQVRRLDRADGRATAARAQHHPPRAQAPPDGNGSLRGPRSRRYAFAGTAARHLRRWGPRRRDRRADARGARAPASSFTRRSDVLPRSRRGAGRLVGSRGDGAAVHPPRRLAVRRPAARQRGRGRVGGGARGAAPELVLRRARVAGSAAARGSALARRGLTIPIVNVNMNVIVNGS